MIPNIPVSGVDLVNFDVLIFKQLGLSHTTCANHTIENSTFKPLASATKSTNFVSLLQQAAYEAGEASTNCTIRSIAPASVKSPTINPCDKISPLFRCNRQ
jgi:hypothetical protein